MNTHNIELAIEEQLSKRAKRVINRNAISALFGAFSDPVGALGKIFMGRADALDSERTRLQQDAILELLCKIDAALSDLARSTGAQGITIDGLIEINAQNVDAVVGVDISEGAGPVVFKPGTHIRVNAESSGSAIGLKIG
jgi:hypothetical protein